MINNTATLLRWVLVNLEVLFSSILVVLMRVLNLMLSFSFVIGSENKQVDWIFQSI